MGSTAEKRNLGPLSVPPGRPNEPYVLQSLCGELFYIPCSRSVTRLAVTGKETDNAFAVVGSGGAAGAPIGYHYHRDSHDVFLCLRGNVNVWAGDECRTLSPGDFASVPPMVVHQYQILGEYTEFVGLIVPGGWEEFFRFIGEPYDGPLFPLEDDRNVFEVLIPKLKAAAEMFDMVPVRNHPHVDPQEWITGKDNILPGKLEPYFLRAGTAPKYLLGGVVCGILAGVAESAGRFSIGSIEGYSAHNQDSPLSNGFIFDEVHHAFYLLEGSITFSIKNQSLTLIPGQFVYLPRKEAFRIAIVSRFAKAYVFANGEGMCGVLRKAGRQYKEGLPPPAAEKWDVSSLSQLESSMGFQLVTR